MTEFACIFCSSSMLENFNVLKIQVSGHFPPSNRVHKQSQSVPGSGTHSLLPLFTSGGPMSTVKIREKLPLTLPSLFSFLLLRRRRRLHRHFVKNRWRRATTMMTGPLSAGVESMIDFRGAVEKIPNFQLNFSWSFPLNFIALSTSLDS